MDLHMFATVPPVPRSPREMRVITAPCQRACSRFARTSAMRAGIAFVLIAAALALVPATSPGQVSGGQKGCSTKAQRAHGDFTARLRPKWDGHKPHHWRKIFER